MIRLTPFSIRDFDKFIFWIKSKELLVMIAGNEFCYPLTIDQLQIYLEAKNSYSFNVVEVEKDVIIGHAEIQISEAGLMKIDKLIIGEKTNRSKGIGQQIIKQLLDYSFTILKAKIVELNVFDWNKAAIGCYQKCGFSLNPYKSSTFKVDGNIWTALNMTIEKSEWENQQSKQLTDKQL